MSDIVNNEENKTKILDLKEGQASSVPLSQDQEGYGIFSSLGFDSDFYRLNDALALLNGEKSVEKSTAKGQGPLTLQ